MAPTASDPIPQVFTRRRLLQASSAAAVAAGTGLLAGCGGGSGSDELTHATWNVPASMDTFKDLIKDFDDAKVTLTATPSDNSVSWLSTRLASHTAPDVLTWTYQNMGRFTDGGLVDLSDYLPDDYGEKFLGQYWSAMKEKDGVFGVPLHTDGWGTFMNLELMEKIGATPPKDESEAWSWEEFTEIATEMKKATGKYAFSYFLVGPETGSRWLPVLYMHGGKLLNDDLTAPAIDSDEGVEAIEWSRTWFADGLMSPENSLKASKGPTAETLFADEQVGMMIASDFKMLALKDKLPEEKWTVGPLFQDVGKATNMGGNALVVSTSAKNPELAAEYVKYLCDDDGMSAFCENSSFVPVRENLVEKQLDWVYRPELMSVFAENARTVPEEMVALETMTQFSEIAGHLTDQLELCWTGQQKAKETATKISDGLEDILAK